MAGHVPRLQHLHGGRNRQTKQRQLHEPEPTTHVPSLAVVLLTVDVAKGEHDSSHDPTQTQPFCGIWVFEGGEKKEEHGLGHVLEEIGVSSLGTIEFMCGRVFLCLLVTGVGVGICYSSGFTKAGDDETLDEGKSWDQA